MRVAWFFSMVMWVGVASMAYIIAKQSIPAAMIFAFAFFSFRIQKSRYRRKEGCDSECHY